MALTPLQAFRIIAKEYSSMADEDVEQYIEFVLPMVSEKRFGELYSRAVALLTAHTMKINNVTANADTGIGGGLGELSTMKSLGVASYSEGSTSISFNSSTSSGSSSNTDAEYESTVYGTQYLTLKKSLPNIIIRGGFYG